MPFLEDIISDIINILRVRHVARLAAPAAGDQINFLFLAGNRLLYITIPEI